MASKIDNQSESKFRFTDAVIYDLILLAFFMTIAVMSFRYNPLARSIPLGLGIIGSIMMILQFLVDAFPKVKPKLPFISQSGILSDESSTSAKLSEKSEKSAPVSPVVKQIWWQVLRIIIWMAGFILLLSAVNYLIAVAAFIVGLTRFEAKESWKTSIILALCVVVSFYLLFDILLQVQF